MATKYELRTFQDIINEVLSELGESSSNTTTVNQIKRDINSIYLNEVVPAADWKWTQRYTEVQTEPYFNTGTASVTANSRTVTLTEAPAKSYKGYCFAASGHAEVFKIASHAANSSTVVLESEYTSTTSATVNFKIWRDYVAMPQDCLESIQVTHAYRPKPLEGKGWQEFQSLRASALQAGGRPLYYSTGEKQYPDPYASVTDLPATLTRSASGLIRTVVFAGSLGADTDSLLLPPGRKIEVSGASSPTYNRETVVAEVTTTNTTNDTIKYTVNENLTQTSTSDTGITVKAAMLEDQLYAYRPLFVYPALLDSRTTLKVTYLVEPEALVNPTDEPLIPIQDRIVLVYGVLSRQWVKKRDEQTAITNLAQFEKKLAKMAGRIEDTQDAPRIALDATYWSSKRRRSVDGGFSALTQDGFPGASVTKVSGTANRAAQFGTDGTLESSSTVSTTELGYLDGVTSSIQTQIDAKLGALGSSTDQALTRWDGTTGGVIEDSAFSVNDDGDMSGTGSIQVDNLKLDGNAITSVDSDGNIDITPDGTGKVRLTNLQVTSLTTGVAHVDADGDVTSSAIVNADVDAAAAIAYSKLNLAGSIVNADVGAAAAIARSKLGLGTADHVVINAGDGTFSSEAQLAISRGGTGQTTAQAALDALLPSQGGNVGEFLTTDGTNASWAAAPTAPAQSFALNNLGLNVSVASNIITLALKQADGSTDPGVGTAAVAAGFRGATASNGNQDTVSQTSALSLTLGTAASLGVPTATARTIYVYLFNDAGTLSLGASIQQIDEGALQSSSTTATSNAVIYQASALTSKPVRLIGRFKATWTTAVGWSAITEVSLVPFAPGRLYVEATTAAGQAIGTTATDIIFGTRVEDTHGAFNNTTGVLTAPFAGDFTFMPKMKTASVLIAVNAAIQSSLVTTSKTRLLNYTVGSGGTEPRGFGEPVTVRLAKGDTAKVQGACSPATTLSANANENYITIVGVPTS